MQITLSEAREDRVRFYILQINSANIHFRDATELFDSSESFFEFTEDYGFDIERAEALIIGGNFYKAAEILISEGKVKRAIEVFLQDKKTAKESRGRVAEYLLSELWKLHGFGVPLNSEVADKGLWKLHKRLMEDPSLLETDIENEVRCLSLDYPKYVLKYYIASYV